MRRLTVILVLILLLTACGGGSGEDAPLPTRAASADSNPRVVATSTPSLPPTWTPGPSVSAEQPVGAVVPSSPGTSIPEDAVTYTVQRGDTLGEIAAQFGVTLTALANANNIRNWDVIEVGDVLVIPGP